MSAGTERVEGFSGERASARSLVFMAAAGGVEHDDLVRALRAIAWEPVHRSRNEVDDDADGANSVIHAYTAFDLHLISEEELDSIVPNSPR